MACETSLQLDFLLQLQNHTYTSSSNDNDNSNTNAPSGSTKTSGDASTSASVAPSTKEEGVKKEKGTKKNNDNGHKSNNTPLRTQPPRLAVLNLLPPGASGGQPRMLGIPTEVSATSLTSNEENQNNILLLQELTKQVSALQEELAVATSKVETTSASAITANKELETEKQRAAQLASNETTLLASLQAAKDAYEALQALEDSHKKEHAIAIAAAQAALKEKEAEFAAFRATTTANTKESTKRLQEAEAERKSSLTKQKDLQVKIDILTLSLEKSQQAEAELLDQAAKLKAVESRGKEQLQAAESMVKSANERVKNITLELEAAKAATRGVTQNLEEMEQTLARERNANAKVVADRTNLLQQLNSVNKDLQISTREVGTLRSTIANLQQQVSTKESALVAANLELTNKDRSIGEANTRVSEIGTDLGRVREELTGKERELSLVKWLVVVMLGMILALGAAASGVFATGR